MSEPTSIIGEKLFAAGAPEMPTEVAGYRLDKPLGHGGFGSVWLGIRVQGPAVAIKVANVSAHPFAREIKCLRALRDLSCEVPAFPRVDFVPGYLGDGVLPDGRAYLLQEFVAGGTLDITKPRSADESEALLVRLLQAIEAMHQATRARLGFIHVHADLKPGNIVLAPDGRIVLLDFGAARKVKKTGSTTGLVGTVSHGYCAPEVYAGRQPTPASDVYSVGVLGFELLTGTRLTDAKQYTHKAQLHEALERCGARQPLILAVKRAMEEDALARFPGPQAFLDFLDNPWAHALGLDCTTRVDRDALRQEASSALRRFRHTCIVRAALLTSCALATGWLALPWLMQALRAARPDGGLPDVRVSWIGLGLSLFAWIGLGLLFRLIMARQSRRLAALARQAVLAKDDGMAHACFAAAGASGKIGRKEWEMAVAARERSGRAGG